MHIFTGILCIAGGIAIIAFSSSLSGAFGRRPWADAHLGGTTQGYVLIGFVIIIIGVVVMFGGGGSPTTDVMTGLPVSQ